MTTSSLSIGLLALYVIGIIAVGLWNRKSQSSEDYFLASRSLPSWLLAVTFIASWWGGGSAVELVDDAHKNGLSSFWVFGVPVLLATFLMFLFSKKIRNLATVSQSQMMEQRYNRQAALLLTIFIIIFMVIGASAQVVILGKFFDAFFGISYTTGAIISTLIVLLYSLFGGFKGVVLTDFIQFIFFLFTGIFLCYLVYDQSGGLSAVKEVAMERGAIGFTSFFSNVGDNLAYVITFGTSWMIQANIWQRISAAKHARDAKKMMLISFFAFIPLYLMVTYTGMFSLVLYDTVPEHGIVPDLISKLSSPVLSAVLFVGLCAAIMSTMDSLINTGALSLTVDLYQKYLDPDAGPIKQVKIARWATLIMGGIALLIALRIQSVIKASWIASDFLTSGAFVPLVLGFLWTRGTAKAAVISMVFGLLFATYNLLVEVGVALPVAWEVSSAKHAIIGITCSVIIFVVGSYLTQPDLKKGEEFIRKANYGKPHV